MTRQEYVASLRRYNILYKQWHLYIYLMDQNLYLQMLQMHEIMVQLYVFRICCRKSSGFSRGASMYRGVTRYIYS